MIYKINFKRNSFQLIRLAFTSKKKFKEIVVSKLDIPFNCNNELILKENNKEQLIEYLNKLVSQFHPDISELFLSLRPVFFQVFDIPKPIGLKDNEEDFYLSWKISLFLADPSENYLYGTYQLENNKIRVFVLRKKVYDFFRKSLLLLNGSFQNIYIGLDAEVEDHPSIFIKIDKKLTTTLNKVPDLNRIQEDNPSVISEKQAKISSFKILITFLFLFIILFFGYYGYSSFTDQQTVPDTAKVDKTPIEKDSSLDSVNEKIATIDSNDEKVISSNTEKTDTLLQKPFFEITSLLNADISYAEINFKSKSVFIKDNGKTFDFSVYENISNVEKNQDMTKIIFSKISDKTGVNSAENFKVIKLNNDKDFKNFWNEIYYDNISRIIISRRVDNYYLAVDYD